MPALLVQGVNLAADATLITALLDLQLVRMLRNASGGAKPIVPIGPAPNPEPRRQIHPTPAIEPRPSIEPAPRIEPRLVHQPYRIEPKLAPPPAPPAEPEVPRTAKSPLEPPWKCLPWKCPPPPPPILKVVFKPPDVHPKGTVFDAFV